MASSRTLVTNMWPGACVIASAGLARAKTACGVTPHAQNTGTSLGRMSMLSPQSGVLRSPIPSSDGFPTCNGAPCASGYLFVTSRASPTWSSRIGLMDTTIGPRNAPAGTQGREVMYIGTAWPCSKWRSRTPAFSSALSAVKLQPIKKATRSSRQISRMSVSSSTSSPFR
jgi:hypothetical protein